MQEKTVHLLSTELLTADGYLNRIMTTLADSSELSSSERVQELAHNAWSEINALLTEQMLHPALTHHPSSMPLDILEIKDRISRSTKLLQGVIWLDLEPTGVIQLVVEYINLLYQAAFHLHTLTYQRASLVIPYPRINMIRPLTPRGQQQQGKTAGDQSSITQYHLPLEMVTNYESDHEGQNISSLEWQRQRRYDQLLKKGQQAIQQQKYPEALKIFLQGKRFVDNAEINTLIAWCYSLTNDLQKAKSFCLTAIDLDPDYGPPYNDLGSYLLSEGHAAESLEWFERAKQAVNYQSREFPYINAGRAYITLNDVPRALVEFNTALEMVPHNEELQQTVRKLTLKYQQWKIDNYASPDQLLE